jgi:hypothetical protein
MTREIVITCQKFEIINNGKVYPYFLGALDARELQKVSAAPSFRPETDNYRIASEVLDPPTEHWQRPIEEAKVKKIAARFDLPGEIMPNPVLLAVNPKKRIEVNPDTNAAGQLTGLWSIRIKLPESEAQTDKPLWIIDGQHRVMGMAQTTLSNSPLPFVLLYSDADAYIAGDLARIFAQVTTEATPLDVIHQSWMQFVFHLGEYAEGTADWRAMFTTAKLCSVQKYGDNTNPFYSKIRFNPLLDPEDINPGGFSFDAHYLKDLLKDKYFKISGSQYNLSEDELAREIALAVVALKQMVKKDVSRSAFFGEGASEQKYFRDGFLAGVCSYLLSHGSPRDWIEVLHNLNFQDTEWEVGNWVQTTGGSAGTISKKIAFKCFEEIFKSGKLPENVVDICSYLQGTGSILDIEYKLVDDEDNIIPRSGYHLEPFELATGLPSFVKSIPRNARHIKITSPSVNIGQITVHLKDKPFDSSYHATAFKKGRTFEKNELKAFKDKINLEVKVEFYGARTFVKNITLNVRD